MSARGSMLYRALGVLSRGIGLFYGLGVIGLAAAIALVASEQPGRAGSALRSGWQHADVNEPLRPPSRPGPSSIVVMVGSDEEAARVREHLGDVGRYHGGLPASFLIAESAREAELVRLLLKDDSDRLLIDFLDT